MIDLATCYSLLSQRLEQVLRPLDLNMTQLSLLFHFAKRPEAPRTISQLAQVMNINQPGITKATSAMVEKGWMRREDDPADARTKHLFVTAKGWRALEDAKVATFPLLVDSFSVLSDDGLESFHGQLGQLKQLLDSRRGPVLASSAARKVAKGRKRAEG